MESDRKLTLIFSLLSSLLLSLSSEMATKNEIAGIPVYTVGNDHASTPAVIVFQEYWGITDDILHQAEHIAAQGYYCVVPDIYKGKSTMEAEEAGHLMSNLNWKTAISEVDAVVGKLREHNKDRKVGVTGFCMGGALTLALATLAENKLTCAAPFYGIPPGQLCDLATIRCPVYGFFGAKDAHKGFSDLSAVEGLEKKLKEAGVNYTISIHPTQGHAYMNTSQWSKDRRANQGVPHDDQAVKESFDKLFDFFSKHLKN